MVLHMGRSKISILAYNDVLPLMRATVNEGKNVRVRCQSEAAAIKTVQRMNKARVLDRESNPDLISLFDAWIYRRRGEYIYLEKRVLVFDEVIDDQGNHFDIAEHGRPAMLPDPGESTDSFIKRVERERPEKVLNMNKPPEIDPTKPLDLDIGDENG